MNAEIYGRIVKGTIKTVTGNFVKGNNKFTTAGYFDHAYIYTVPNFYLGGTEDFTVDMMFKCIEGSKADGIWSAVDSRTAKSGSGLGSYYQDGVGYPLEFWNVIGPEHDNYKHYDTGVPYQKNFFHYVYEYKASEKSMYGLLDGKLITKNKSMEKLGRFKPLKIYVEHHEYSDYYYKTPFTFTGHICYFRISNCLRWENDYDLAKIYQQAGIKFNTKRNIYRLYNISYDSLYNYNINDSLLYNNTLRDINKFNNYNNNTLRNVLYNINSLYKDTYRCINKLYNPLYDTKRNIKHDYINILYNTKRLIHNNINIINYIYRKKILSNNINNDTVRSVISWKHKIVTFITNPRYKLR